MRPRIIWFGRHYGTSSRCSFPVIIMPTAKVGRYAASSEDLLEGRSLRSPFCASLSIPVPWSKRPTDFLALSPVGAPLACLRDGPWGRPSPPHLYPPAALLRKVSLSSFCLAFLFVRRGG